MTNGDIVEWTSETGKHRSGVFIMRFNSKPLVLVKGEWDGKSHQMRAAKLSLRGTKKKGGRANDTRS